MIIDGKDTILGRLGTVAAKKALLGEKVDIINCEQVVVSGRKKWLLKETKRRKDQGTFKGPILYRMPDRFVKRAIRGMIPYKKPKGREALKRIMCYVGVPEQFKDKKAEKLEKSTSAKLPNLKYTTIKQICKTLGGKIE